MLTSFSENKISEEGYQGELHLPAHGMHKANTTLYFIEAR